MRSRSHTARTLWPKLFARTTTTSRRPSSGRMPAPRRMKGGITSPQLATRTMAAFASHSTPSMVITWARAPHLADQPERGGDVGRHAPAALVLRQRLRHDARIVAGPARHGEVLRPRGPLHPAEIEGSGAGGDQGLGGAGRSGGNPEVAGEEVAGPAGYDAERHVRTDQRRGGLHRGAVPTEHGHDVHLFRHAVCGKAPRIAGPAGGQHLRAPPGLRAAFA